MSWINCADRPLVQPISRYLENCTDSENAEKYEDGTIGAQIVVANCGDRQPQDPASRVYADFSHAHAPKLRYTETTLNGRLQGSGEQQATAKMSPVGDDAINARSGLLLPPP